MPSKKKPATAGMTASPSVSKELLEQLTGGITPMTADQINATVIVRQAGLLISRKTQPARLRASCCHEPALRCRPA